MLIDTDPQSSLSSWWNERKAETPIFASVNIANLANHLRELESGGVKLAIIDTPPAVTETIRVVIAVADLVLIPTRPSPHDLRAVGSTVEMVGAASKPMVFVINGAAARARITGEAAIALSQHGTVAPITIYQCTDFAASMIDGRTVQEITHQAGQAKKLRNYGNTLTKNCVNLRIASYVYNKLIK